MTSRGAKGGQQTAKTIVKCLKETAFSKDRKKEIIQHLKDYKMPQNMWCSARMH